MLHQKALRLVHFEIHKREKEMYNVYTSADAIVTSQTTSNVISTSVCELFLRRQ